MNKASLTLAALAVLASSAGVARKAQMTAAPKAGGAVAMTAPHGDWSQVTTASRAGGFIMGNPNAKVKLVEFGSLTCPHCGTFDKVGAGPLVERYVKSGKVSWEYRNFVRDPYDITASLIARCNGAKSFFGLMHAIFATQPLWYGKLQAVPQPQMDAIAALPTAKQFPALAKLMGLPRFATMRGVPLARVNACLANQAEVAKLVQMNSAAVSGYNIPGTPSFLLNGSLLGQTATWEALEPKLKAAL